MEIQRRVAGELGREENSQGKATSVKIKIHPHDTNKRGSNIPFTGTNYSNRNSDKMQVMCVRKLSKHCIIDGSPMPAPEIGDIDTVVDSVNTHIGVCYELERFGKQYLYQCNAFATLPPDEPAVVNEREFEGVIYQR